MTNERQICKQCKKTLPLDGFYKQKDCHGGRRKVCKNCMTATKRERTRERYANDAEYRKKEKERCASYQKKNSPEINKRLRESGQNSVHSKIRKAIKKGTIIRPEYCADCGLKPPKDAHHDDYSKQLEVVWLCRACHMKRHYSIPEYPWQQEMKQEALW